ncbi:hypothetical protein YM304_00350 [Ilumatobacter coccineus YM16-304]|uniref:Right handed beta helix domain-containing protein n=2 Tax=Ilumatobacter coccineus TaxID=467094 RepID=A0A6C7E4T0_ILUCY|nr:hypothetical protein YM304_00350 [Ilumatobacter coccineus YM16-304]
MGAAAAIYVIAASAHGGASWSVFAATDDQGALRGYGIRLATAIAGVVAGTLAWGRLELSRNEHRRQLAVEKRLSSAAAAAQRERDSDRQRDATADVERRAELDRDRHRSDFTAAVEQLGHEHRSVRLAGLLALEGLAQAEHADVQRLYDIVCAFARERLPVDVTTFENVIHLSHTQNFDGVVDVAGQGELLNGPEVLHLAVDYAEAVAIALRAPKGIKVNLQRTLVVDQTIRIDRRNGESLDLTDAIILNSRFDGDPRDSITFYTLRKAALYNCDWSLSSGGGITLKNCRVFGSKMAMRASLKSLRFFECRILHSQVATNDATVLSMRNCDLQKVRFGSFSDEASSNIRDCSFHRCAGSLPAGDVRNNEVRHCDLRPLTNTEENSAE